MFSTKLSRLASQNWLQWLTLQAKLVSCQFNARRVKRGYFNCQACSVLSNTLHAHCAHRYFAHRAVVYLVSVLLDLGMSVSCSYHVIMSSPLCYVATLLHPILPPDVDEVFDEASALLELEQLKKRVGELEKKLGAHKQQRKPHGLKFLVRDMST